MGVNMCNDRSMIAQNIQAIRIIDLILRGVMNAGSSYVDLFLHKVSGLSNAHEWYEGTEIVCEALRKQQRQIKKGMSWNGTDGCTNILFTVLAFEDKKFWDGIQSKMLTIETITKINV